MMLAVCLVSVPALGGQDTGRVYSINIPQLKVDAALNALAKQTGTQLLFPYDLVKTLDANPVSGDYRLKDALEIILRSTGLSSSLTDGGVITISLDSSIGKNGELTMNRKSKLSLFASILALFGSGLTTTDAMSEASDTEASNTNPKYINEVVVTATKRSESIQDVPVSISALSTEDIEQQGIENFADFSRQIPGILKNDGAKNFGIFTIRGISATNDATDQQYAVATYVDDMPVSNGARLSADLRLYDIERVEILRGPQGTLFGSGTLSGAVRVITKKADPDGFEASTSVDYGLTDGDSLRQRYNAMVNIPLVENELAVRVVGYYRDEEGYVDNIGIGKKNSNTNVDWGGRTSVRWQPNERFTATFGLLHEDTSPEDFQFFDPSLGKHVRSTRIADKTALETTNYSAVLEYDLGWASLVSSTTYSETYVNQITDVSGLYGPVAPFALAVEETSEAIAQEIRLVSTLDSPFEWVIGAFYFDRDRNRRSDLVAFDDFLSDLNITGLPASDIPSAGGTSIFSDQYSLVELTEAAAFGDFSYHLSDEWTLNIGLRYGVSELTKTSFGDKGGSALGGFFGAAFTGGNQMLSLAPVAASSFGTGSQNKLTKKFSVTWQPSDSKTYYVLASEGYRIDTPNLTTNNGVSVLDPDDIVIPDNAKSDSLWNYEVGVKADWLDGCLRTNLALFYIDWKDLQVQATRVSDGVNFFTNVGEAVSKGVELETLAWPTDSLEVGLNLGWMDPKITSLTDAEAAISGGVDGQQLAAPRFQIAGFVRHTWQLGHDQELYVRIDAQHVGSHPSGLPNVPGNPDAANTFIEDTEAHQYVGSSIGWQTSNWSLVFYGENLLNNDNYIYVYPNANLRPNRYGTLRPRTFGLRVNWSY